MKKKDIERLEEFQQLLSGASLGFSPWWNPNKGCSQEERDMAAQGLDADSRSLMANKRIIDIKHPAWKAVASLKITIYTWWRNSTLPYVVEGQRLFLREHRDTIWNQVEEYKDHLDSVVKGLDKVREELIAQAKKSLGKMFNEFLYPDTWVGKFGLELREFSIEPPNYLMTTDEKAYRREVQQRLLDLDYSLTQFETQCAAKMGDILARMVHGMEDGNRVTDANFTAAKEIFNRVAQMKFEGTAVFKKAMQGVKEVLEDADPDEIRKDKKVRDTVREELLGVIQKHSQLQTKVQNRAS